MHLEYSHFVRCAEAVLDATQEAIGVIAFTFEIEYSVGNMLQGFGTSDSTFLGDMANDEDGRMRVFGQLHELKCAFTYLADAPRSGGQMTGKHGLNRIYYNQGWFQAVESFSNHLKFDRGEQVELLSTNTQAFGPHFDLLNRLFARDIEDGANIL